MISPLLAEWGILANWLRLHIITKLELLCTKKVCMFFVCVCVGGVGLFPLSFFFLFPEFVAICVYLLQIMNTSTAEKN